MSDVSGVKITDVFGLKDPLTKLIETISNAIGKIYEPTHERRLARAESEKIGLLCNTISEHNNIPILYKDAHITIDGTDCSELVKRAESRFVFSELKKQDNIDRVVNFAAQDLSNKESITAEPVDSDWTTRFFDTVSSISSEEMQIIWGKILAGEVNKPGSFSLRTLETVKNMSKIDAEAFVKVAPYLLTSNNEQFVLSDQGLLNTHQLPYGLILLLDECGLMNSSGTLSFHLPIRDTDDSKVYNSERLAIIKGKIQNDSEVVIGIHNLTRAGKELFSIIETKPNNAYFHDAMHLIGANNKERMIMSIYKVNEIKNNLINYQIEAIEVIQ